jgi:hypothetical protein
MLKSKGKARITVDADIEFNGKIAGNFSGEFAP